jgi:hypothetical protein
VLSFLPLGALIFPFIAFRGALNRLHRQFGQRENKSALGRKERQGIVGLALSYTLIMIVASLGSRSTDVYPRWWWAPVIVISLIAAAQFTLTVPTGAPSLTRDITRITVIVVGALLGIGALAYSISLLFHFSVVRDLYTVLNAGIIGGALLTILGILTLPNMAISSLSYLLGSGFSIGSGTLISPGVHRLNEIPAFPLLGAIPTKIHPYLYLGVLIGIATGIFLATILQRTSLREYRWGFMGYPILLTGVIFLLTLLSNGSVLGGALSMVGPSLWQFPLLFLAEISLGMGLKFAYDKWGPK